MDIYQVFDNLVQQPGNFKQNMENLFENFENNLKAIKMDFDVLKNYNNIMENFFENIESCLFLVQFYDKLKNHCLHDLIVLKAKNKEHYHKMVKTIWDDYLNL